MREMLFDKPLPPEPTVFLTKLSMVSSPDMMPVCSSPVQDKLAEAWDAVKDDARVAKMSQELHPVGMCSLPRVLFRVDWSWHSGETVNAIQNNGQQIMPVITATVSAVTQSDIGKKIKDGIDKFSEGMPVLLNALDELKAVHPFIGGELTQ